MGAREKEFGGIQNERPIKNRQYEIQDRLDAVTYQTASDVLAASQAGPLIPGTSGHAFNEAVSLWLSRPMTAAQQPVRGRIHAPDPALVEIHQRDRCDGSYAADPRSVTRSCPHGSGRILAVPSPGLD